MKNKLKPCPFCGGQARFKTITYGEDCSGVHFNFEIRCKECEVGIPKAYALRLTLETDGEIVLLIDERSIAIEEWNNRQKEENNDY